MVYLYLVLAVAVVLSSGYLGYAYGRKVEVKVQAELAALKASANKDVKAVESKL